MLNYRRASYRIRTVFKKWCRRQSAATEKFPIHEGDIRATMLKNMMEALVVYMERDMDKIYWNTDDNHKFIYNEMQEIRKWWDSYSELPDVPDDCSIKQYAQADEEHEALEVKMTNRLMNIRQWLWYC